MKLVQMADAVRFPRMTTEELRSTFLIEAMFVPGAVTLSYVDADRAVVGGAVPLGEELVLSTYPELRAEFFCERRELGVLNVGGPGRVVVDGVSFPLSKLDCLYVGRGAKDVRFVSDDADKPASFYLLSYPAHAEFPTALAKLSDLDPVKLGSMATCNARSIYKAIWMGGVRSCQLVMGFTLLDEGSNWNTMPPHTHMRRSEIYMYFNLEETSRVFHMMGPPTETRHLIVGNQEIVVSPGWSIHAGVGTKHYGFCWGMGGENQAYDDMDPAPVEVLR